MHPALRVMQWCIDRLRGEIMARRRSFNSCLSTCVAKLLTSVKVYVHSLFSVMCVQSAEYNINIASSLNSAVVLLVLINFPLTKRNCSNAAMRLYMAV